MKWKDFLNNPIIPWMLFVAALIAWHSSDTTWQMKYDVCCGQEMHWEQIQSDATLHPKAGEEIPIINDED